MPPGGKECFPTASRQRRGPSLSKQDAGHTLSWQRIKPELHTLSLISVWAKHTIRLAQHFWSENTCVLKEQVWQDCKINNTIITTSYCPTDRSAGILVSVVSPFLCYLSEYLLFLHLSHQLEQPCCSLAAYWLLKPVLTHSPLTQWSVLHENVFFCSSTPRHFLLFHCYIFG